MVGDTRSQLPATQNVLLAALPARERDALLRGARRTTLLPGALVYEQEQRLEDVYFPLSGALSILAVLAGGETLEAGVIGREGVLGFPLGLGPEPSPWRSVVQLPGQAIVVDRDALRLQLQRSGVLGALLTHYAGLLMAMLVQSGACNHFHSVSQRSARWLLAMHDRSDGDSFPMTQQFLSEMLGARRPSVTEAVQGLRNAGCIAYTRGAIAIADRAALEAAACECYAQVRRRFAMLTGGSGGGATDAALVRASGDGTA